MDCHCDGTLPCSLGIKREPGAIDRVCDGGQSYFYCARGIYGGRETIRQGQHTAIDAESIQNRRILSCDSIRLQLPSCMGSVTQNVPSEESSYIECPQYQECGCNAESSNTEFVTTSHRLVVSRCHYIQTPAAIVTHAIQPQKRMVNNINHLEIETKAFDCILSKPSPVINVGAYESKPALGARPVIVKPMCGSKRQFFN